jgi:glycosyltransferase involved in cell wall biosynthesis
MKAKKRVLLVNVQPLRRGGAQAVIMSIVRNLSDEFCFDIALFSDEPGWYDEEFLSYGGKIIRLPNYSGNNIFRQRADLYMRWPGNAKRLKKAILENGPYDVIHTIVAYEAGYMLKVAKQAGVPTRVAQTLVITNIPRSKVAMRCYSAIALKAIRKYSTCLIGCTNEACATMFGADSKLWSIIRNPYNAERFDPQLFPEIAEHEAPSLIQVASYSANKNQMFTIEVFKEIVKRHPRATLRFVGFELEEGYLQSMQEKIKDYGLEEHVTFYPSDADIPQLMSQSSYFMLPSVNEGFGIVLVEAQALGLRCVVSDSVPRLPDCGGCTFIPFDASRWAQCILDDFAATKGVRMPYDCEAFKETSVMNDYRRLYRTGRV